MCSSLLYKVVDTVDGINYLYDEVVVKFTRVMHAQYRKDYLRQLHTPQKDMYRKEIPKKKSQGLAEAGDVQMKDIESDTSDNLQLSHLRLKSKIIQQSTYLQGKLFTRNQLQVLCQAYSIPFNKKVLASMLADKIK